MPRLLPILLLLTAGPAFAQETQADAGRPWSLRLFFENDSLFPKPFDSHDEHYTNGLLVLFTQQHEFGKDAIDTLTFWADDDDRRPGRGGWGAGIGQLMFTPQDTDTAALIPDDQPYAGYLFGTFHVERDDAGAQADPGAVVNHDRLEVTVGVVGPASYAQELQRWTHEVFGADDIEGWDNQLRHEIAGELGYVHKWRVPLAAAADEPFGVQVIPQVGTRLGTLHVDAHAAATFRLGWNLPDDFGPGRIDDKPSSTGLLATGANREFSLYFFARGGGRAVVHDLFLEGNTYRGSPGVDAENLVGEASAGVVVGFCRYFELSYVVTYLTDQFEDQDRPSSYATLLASFRCGF